MEAQQNPNQILCRLVEAYALRLSFIISYDVFVYDV